MSPEEGFESDEVTTEDLERVMADANSANRENQQAQVLSMGGGLYKDPNLIQIQIETTEMLERLEHFYRGDYVGPNKKGDLVWQKQTNDELVTFNDFGVTSLMEVITKYIDKNTILSHYSEERIYEIMGDLGEDLVLFLFCNYEKIGMDTYFKKTKFRMIITSTLHIIESTYRRAIRSKAMEEINQSRIISQSDHLNLNPGGMEHTKKRGGIMGMMGFR